MNEKCFACGRALGTNPSRVDTRDDQTVFVGRECFKRVQAAGGLGYQPPTGGPRLYLLCIGWTKGDGTGHDGYNVADYFDAVTGKYLGADQHGIEPIFGG